MTVNELDTSCLEVSKVAVVGCGVMGSGIAEACATAGVDVTIIAKDSGSISRGQKRIDRSMMRAVEKGTRSNAERSRTLDRMEFSTDLSAALGCDLLIEAVPEDESAKAEVFCQLDRIGLAYDTILASTTSSVPIMRIGSNVRCPENVIGLHFFNPVMVLDLVEVVPSLITGEGVRDRAERFISGTLGKHVVRAPDRAGFTVNAMLIPYVLSAIRMCESGAARAEDIDKAMVLGCAHPMGPLALADLIGLDIVDAVADSLYREFRELHYSPPPLLRRMVEAGLLGRKSGQGFFAYADRG
ncbi:3-hydroxybutyryl-CoA dehydrogenase [Saccharomonospora sp. NPDC006951]